jgi:hypothetical protein
MEEKQFLKIHFQKTLKQGLLMFPLTYSHRGEIPISSDKYIITEWIHFKKNYNC